MNLTEIYQQFFGDIKNTTPIEYIAVFTGIASVWYSRKENILVYPTGLINTIIYVYISFKGGLLGEASVNIYYTIMSFYGWVLWSKKDQAKRNVLKITVATKREWLQHIVFFAAFYSAIFFALTYLKKDITKLFAEAQQVCLLSLFQAARHT